MKARKRALRGHSHGLSVALVAASLSEWATLAPGLQKDVYESLRASAEALRDVADDTCSNETEGQREWCRKAADAHDLARGFLRELDAWLRPPKTARRRKGGR